MEVTIFSRDLSLVINKLQEAIDDIQNQLDSKIEEYEKSTKFDKFIEGVTRIFPSIVIVLECIKELLS